MKNIKIPGTGCANCKITMKLIEDSAGEKNIMSTPGVVVDGKVVHAVGVPSRDKIAGWL